MELTANRHARSFARRGGVGLAGVLLLVAGCSRTATCLDLANNCVVDADTGEPEPEPDDQGVEIFVAPHRDVDVLFVIDNSGSMGEEQAILAANAEALIEVLEGLGANYRIGITTSDNGNPWCPSGSTTPEGGELVSSSCKDRLGDFIFNNGELDVQDLACNDICTLGDADLEILPTTTSVDPQPRPRPWLERIDGVGNLPASTDTAAAFACFEPQGINGCGFESQLESMYLGLLRTRTADEGSYGFIRTHASLAVVFVTDEVDCSYDKDHAEIFDADGARVFWSDPTGSFPSSALCWNAGVECVGDPSAYASCDPVNKGVDGAVGVSDELAVLHPVGKYIDLLRELEDEKQAFDPELAVTVTLIAGVTASGEPFYADIGDVDPEFQDNFGIGPGCEAPNPLDPDDPIRALPPVRLRDLSEAFSPGNMVSICEPDYSDAFTGVASTLISQISPGCYDACAEDRIPGTPLLEPDCVVEATAPGGDAQLVEECLRDAGGAYVIDAQTQDYAMPSAGANVCYALRVDAGGQSPDPGDDMSAECVDGSYNLEFAIAQRPTQLLVGGTRVRAQCVEADDPELVCPGIGG